MRWTSGGQRDSSRLVCLDPLSSVANGPLQSPPSWPFFAVLQPPAPAACQVHLHMVCGRRQQRRQRSGVPGGSFETYWCMFFWRAGSAVGGWFRVFSADIGRTVHRHVLRARRGFSNSVSLRCAHGIGMASLAASMKMKSEQDNAIMGIEGRNVGERIETLAARSLVWARSVRRICGNAVMGWQDIASRASPIIRLAHSVGGRAQAPLCKLQRLAHCGCALRFSRGLIISSRLRTAPRGIAHWRLNNGAYAA